jgi:hypothetical protein
VRDGLISMWGPGERPDWPGGSGAESDWTLWRPAPTVRAPLLFADAVGAVDGLLISRDLRVSRLGMGARLAFNWAAIGAHAPVSGRFAGTSPRMAEIVQEIYDASGGVRGPAAFGSDGDRIEARGVQEWLAWAYCSDYPTPTWLVMGTRPGEIHAQVLGRVGIGPAGMDGPQSSAPFVYEVGDWLKRAGAERSA